MNVRQISASLIILVTSFLLVACSAVSSGQPAVLVAPISQEKIPANPESTEPKVVEESQVEPATQFWGEQNPLVDQQGAVVVEITPVNLNNPGQTLDFQISLNTHSVDLSMDLAALSTLKTDTGHTVQAAQWDAPLGGHHVSGKLYFPAVVDGVPLLTDATRLILTVVNLDAPERVFVWEK